MLTAQFKEHKFYEKREFVGNETGVEFAAMWVKISEFTQGQKILYPDGFVDTLT